MTTLLPNTNAQIISIIPRSYVVASDLTLKIIEDGTKKNQSLTGLTSALSSNGNFLNISCTFSILAEDGNYYHIEDGMKGLPKDGKAAEAISDYVADTFKLAVAHVHKITDDVVETSLVICVGADFDILSDAFAGIVGILFICITKLWPVVLIVPP